MKVFKFFAVSIVLVIAIAIIFSVNSFVSNAVNASRGNPVPASQLPTTTLTYRFREDNRPVPPEFAALGQAAPQKSAAEEFDEACLHELTKDNVPANMFKIVSVHKFATSSHDQGPVNIYKYYWKASKEKTPSRWSAICHYQPLGQVPLIDESSGWYVDSGYKGGK